MSEELISAADLKVGDWIHGRIVVSVEVRDDEIYVESAKVVTSVSHFALDATLSASVVKQGD